MSNKRGASAVVLGALLVVLIVAVVSVLVIKGGEVKLGPNGSGASCYDTDGGINYNLRGTASANGMSKTDVCSSGNVSTVDYLTEYYCTNASSIASTNYNCPNGCLNGACKNQTVTPPVNGVCGSTLNSCVVGTLQDINDSATSYLWNCLGLNGGLTAICNIPKPSTNDTCADSDGGINYYVKGSMTSPDVIGIKEDWCWGGNSSNLGEYFCSGNVGNLTTYSCPSGCLNGACNQNNNTNVSYALAVSKLGNGMGSVTSLPTGINCGSTCTSNFNAGTIVTLSASPSAGSTFNGWSGMCTGSGTTCTVNMDSAKSVTATFSIGNQTLFDYVISVPNVAITQSSTSAQTSTITKVAGTPQVVTVSVASLPIGISVSTSSQSCTPTSGSCSVTFTYSASTSVAPGAYLISLASQSPGVSNKLRNFTLTVNPRPAPQPFCFDTDGGLNYFVRGTMNASNAGAIKTDYCEVGFGNNTLAEYYCMNSTVGSLTWYDCPLGCNNGVCIKSSTNQS